MELLAPAGNAENFLTALDAGADAIYVGAPGFNARNPAREVRLDEIAAMIRHCREAGRKIYIAANSLLLERELPRLLETLAILEELQPDALIVQDQGMINLLRYYFPGLKYHASTLMGVHNLMGVNFYARLGCERVVLARELTTEEIGFIRDHSDVELEVFVHGAMCFSYSGHCLFSSYLGGKSGLRGKCVQPCRRSYSTRKGGRSGGTSGKGGYLFSMNDLDGLSAVRELKDMGIASLKIEGRLRSANYVDKVVRAYRLILDADEAEYPDALEEAGMLLASAMARKSTDGYFSSSQPPDAIVPAHSGNLGLHLGRGKKHGKRLKLTLKEPLAIGDRLRFHAEPSGERVAVSLKHLYTGSSEVQAAKPGEKVAVPVPENLEGRFDFVDLYKVDSKGVEKDSGRSLDTGEMRKVISNIKNNTRRTHAETLRKVWETAHSADKLKQLAGGGKGSRAGRSRPGAAGKKKHLKLPIEWWLRVDSVKMVMNRLPFTPDRYVIEMNRLNVNQAGQVKKIFGKGIRNITWALPTVISDGAVARFHKMIATLLRAGFRSFQVGQLGQAALFAGERVFLSGDYSLNLINNQALLSVAGAGFECAQLAIEGDRDSLREAVQGYKQFNVPASKRGGGKRTMRLGLTVYGAPPLFTSRMDPAFFAHGKPLVSPKQEVFSISRGDGVTLTRPGRPFSLLPYLEEINRMGVDYAVIDLSGMRMGKKELGELEDRLAGAGRYAKLPTFNYLGKLE